MLAPLATLLFSTLILSLGSRSESSVRLAAPWIIIIEATPSQPRIVLADWEENSRFFQGLSIVSPAETLATEERREAALYWGPEWAGWKARRIRPDTLSFSLATQRATVLLRRGVPTHIVFRGSRAPNFPVRRLSPAAVDILVRGGLRPRGGLR